MTHGSTRAGVLYWFARGAVARTPDGTEVATDVEPVVLGRADGAPIELSDVESSAVRCELRGAREAT
jgi:hypothetical protein